MVSNGPYVRVTGVSDAAQMEKVAGIFERNGYTLGDYHKPSVGILLAENSFEHPEIPYGPRYPVFADINEILQTGRKRVVSSISLTTKVKEKIHKQVKSLYEKTSVNLCNNVQLNVVWPVFIREHLEVVQRVKEDYPFVNLSLRMGGEASNPETIQPNHLVEHLLRYEGLVSGITIDQSHGEGKPIQLERMISLYRYVRSRDELRGIDLCFSGGVCASTLRSILPAFLQETEYIGDISIDALRCLRIPRNLPEKDRRIDMDDFDFNEVEDYVKTPREFWQ